MQGPEAAGQLVADAMTARLPARLAALSARLALPSPIPPPGLVAAQERGPLPLEAWPAVYALPQALESLRFVDLLPGGRELYLARYTVRLVVWVRAEDYAATDTLRKRYALAVRETLLERKALAAGASYSGPLTFDAGEVAVDPASIREDYSDVLTDGAGATIAGAYVDVTVAIAETLETSTPLGRVETTTVTTRTLDQALDTSTVPTHPAL